ncbi:MAG: hypothetical protein KIH03_08170 [Paludibacteraceae bacterium]|nr:hypothetical protein [Paludibacteraceae bacterium]
MKNYNCKPEDPDYDDEIDGYWEQQPGEDDEDYIDRKEDSESFLESFDD